MKPRALSASALVHHYCDWCVIEMRPRSAFGRKLYFCMALRRGCLPLPPEIGDLENLLWFTIQGNPLSGPLPRELMQLETLDLFSYYDTDLCEPPDSIFQTWLQSIPNLGSNGIRCDTTLGSNYPDGALGSNFEFEGTMFEPKTMASVKANGIEIGQVRTDAKGRIRFSLDTSSADEGTYRIEVVTLGLVAETILELDTDSPLRQPQGNSPTIQLPKGLSATQTPSPTHTSTPTAVPTATLEPTNTPQPDKFEYLLPIILGG